MTGWRMPAETEPHERTWMAWPAASYTLGDTAAEAEQAWTAWSAVANAIADHEPLSMLVTPDGLAEARRRLSSAVELHECPLDDAWYRDIGPTFVVGEAGDLGAVNWVFNGWGQQEWARWEHDALASEVATAATAATRIGLTDGQRGRRHPHRRRGHVPGHRVRAAATRLATRAGPVADVEAELARTVGAAYRDLATSRPDS